MISNPNCTDCKLHIGSTNVCHVNDTSVHRPLMIIGESPSFEDNQRRSILTHRILEGVMTQVHHIDPAYVHKSVMVKCRGVSNDLPGPQEYDACMHYLMEEIAAVKPKAILTLGETVSKYFTGRDGISESRGTIYMTNGYFDENRELVQIPVIPTFAPGFAERNDFGLKAFAQDMLKAYQIAVDYKTPDNNIKAHIVDTLEKVDQLMDNMEKAGIVAFDFESSGLDYWGEDFFATVLSISYNPGVGYIVPIYHKEPIFNDKNKVIGFEEPIFNSEQVQYILDQFKTRFLANKNIRKIAHNLKFDLHVFRSLGIHEFRGRFDDTMLMHADLHSGLGHGLKEISNTYYSGYTGYEDEVAKYNWNAVPMKLLAPYAATDTDLTLKLRLILEAEMLEDPQTYIKYRNLSMPLLFTLEKGEFFGACIDMGLANEYIAKTKEMQAIQEAKMREYKQVKKYEKAERYIIDSESIKALEDKLRDLEVKYPGKDNTFKQKARDRIAGIKAGTYTVYEHINFGSTKQLPRLMYFENGFQFKPVIDKKTNKPLYSTDKDVLIDVKDNTGFIADLQKWRSMGKMLSTYLEGISEKVDRYGRVHASFNQHSVITGRLSCTSPPLQTLPSKDKVKDPETKEIVGYIKKMFSVPKGYRFIAVDFSQAELRTIAHFAGEANMLKAYANNLDLHILTAAASGKLTIEQFMGLSEDDRKSMRSKAKSVNFGLIYGMSWESLIEYAKLQYGVIFTEAEAKEMHNSFFRTYPKLVEYHEIYKAKARRFKYVRTLFGFKVWCRDIDSPNGKLQAKAERLAINCVSDDTEILTAEGWKHVTDLKLGENVYSVDPITGLLELQPLKKINIHEVDDELVEIENNAISSISTKNHRWLVDSKRTKGVKVGFIESSNLSNHGDHRIWLTAKGSDFKGDGSWSDDQVALIGWILTGGFYSKHKRKDGSYGVNSSVGVCQSKIQNISDIQSLFDRIGKHGHHVSKIGEHFWSVSGELGLRIKNVLPKRILTMTFLLQLSTKQLYILYETMLKGDGCSDATAGYYRRFCSATEERSNAFLMLCVLVGKAAKAFTRDQTGYSPVSSKMSNIPKMGINWLVELKQRTKAYSNIGKRVVKYKGVVWCPTVDNGTWVAKRNGKVYITGNSPIQGSSGQWCEFAMALLEHRLDKRVQFVVNVHDAIYYYVPEEIWETSLKMIRHTCEQLPVMAYFNNEMSDVVMKIDAEQSKVGWKELESVIL